jgi:hypothetical protein
MQSYLLEELESSSDHVRRWSSAAGSRLSTDRAIDFRATSSRGMIRKPELSEPVVGEDSSRPGVADFLLPRPFNDLNPGIGIVMNDW